MRSLFFALMFCQVSSVSAAELTAEEIRDSLVGRDIAWWENEGWHAGALFLLPNGRAEISVNVPDVMNDSGSWNLSGNRICTNWSSVRSGEEKCYSVHRGERLGRFLTSGGNVFVVQEAGT